MRPLTQSRLLDPTPFHRPHLCWALSFWDWVLGLCSPSTTPEPGMKQMLEK